MCYFLFLLTSIFLNVLVECREDVKMSLIDVKSFPAVLNFTVRSRLYSEYPNLLFVTTRGSGLSIFNIADAKKPRLVATWDESKTVEGQDIANGLLVLVDLSDNPGLWIVDVSKILDAGELKTRGFVRMPSGVCSLHVNLFENSCGLFAILSNNGHYWKEEMWFVPPDVKPTGIVIVDINNPSNPTISSVLPLEQVVLPEGVLVIHGKKNNSMYALVGGYGGPFAAIVDISDVHNPYVAKAWSEPYFSELNSLIRENEPELVYSALYGSPGGLVSFNISAIPDVEVVSNIVNEDLSGANRVNMHPSKPFLFLPLEQSAGIGVVDVSDPKIMRQAGLEFVHGQEKVFCLAIHPSGDYLYAFGAFKSVFIYTLDFEENYFDEDQE